MKLAVATTTLALLSLATAPALASAITLDFETAPSFGSIDTLYAGQGVNFGGDVLGLQNDALGPYFSNAPSPLGVMISVGAASTMNVDGGFVELSFFYASSADVAGAVEVWSGVDATGTLLASLSLTNNAQTGCTDTAYCNFSLLGSQLSARAYSVSFAAAANVAAFDNVVLQTVPEPTSALLAGLGLMGLALSRRR